MVIIVANMRIKDAGCNNIDATSSNMFAMRFFLRPFSSTFIRYTEPKAHARLCLSLWNEMNIKSVQRIKMTGAIVFVLRIEYRVKKKVRKVVMYNTESNPVPSQWAS